ncbi:Ubiquitin-like protein 3, partial [Camponotus floridanus]
LYALQINLRLILVSGKTKEFLFSPSDSAGDIAHHVFENWPDDWAEEAVAKAEILRLIYQGRFLHSNVTLGALGLPFGKTTVMHLVPRENLPEPNSQVAELVSSVAREKEGKKDYVAPVPVERSDDEEQTMRAATVRFPNGADGMSSSGISVRLVGDNACSIDTRSRGKLRSERRERRANRVALPSERIVAGTTS